ncbi:MULTISPECIES: hypothetical protein [Streptomyces]|uniref:hypothetical protein n=1 Tax=Streptomyces TaxID=1883 RepID=UPI0014889977|nr:MULTISPECIES: hypothetical protein [Streptomyces]
MFAAMEVVGMAMVVVPAAFGRRLAPSAPPPEPPGALTGKEHCAVTNDQRTITNPATLR